MRYGVGLAALGFVAACFWAYGEVGWSGFDIVIAQPWGVVTTLDVMLGAVCMGAVIFHYEEKPLIAALWSLAIFPLGHVVSAAWLILRFQRARGGA